MLTEVNPRRTDVAHWLRQKDNPWVGMSVFDFSVTELFSNLVVTKATTPVGEGVVFLEELRTETFTNTKRLMDQCFLIRISTKDGGKNLSFYHDAKDMTEVLLTADALNAWINPELIGTIGRWKLPQERLKKILVLPKIRVPITRNDSLAKNCSLRAFASLYKEDEAENPKYLEICYDSPREDDLNISLWEAENLNAITKAQRKWFERDPAGKLRSPAPADPKKLLDTSTSALIRWWTKLLMKKDTQAGHLDLDISTLLTEEDLDDIFRWTETVDQADFNTQNLTKFLASRWIKRTRPHTRRIWYEKDYVEKLKETGGNLRETTNPEIVEKLYKLADCIRIDPGNQFWRFTAAWLRQVYQLSYSWHKSMQQNTEEIPETLFFFENGADLTRRKKEKDEYLSPIPSVIEETSSTPTAWLLIDTAPLQLVLINLEYDKERITQEMWIWQKLAKTMGVKKEVQESIRRWIATTQRQGFRQAADDWKNLVEKVNDRNCEGNLRVLIEPWANSTDEQMLKNIRQTLIYLANDDIMVTRARLRKILGKQRVSNEVINFEDIETVEADSLPYDFTTQILNGGPVRVFQTSSEHRPGICRVIGCSRRSGNFQCCNKCGQALPMIFDNLRDSRMVVDLSQPTEKKVIARERWTEPKIMNDVHPHTRAEIHADIIDIQSTQREMGGARDKIAAILAEKYLSGVQRDWGHSYYRNNENLLRNMRDFAENFQTLKEKAHWCCLQEQTEGVAILFPLLSINDDGKRKYADPLLVQITKGSYSRGILLRELPDNTEKLWTKTKFKLRHVDVLAFIDQVSQLAEMYDAENYLPEFEVMRDIITKQKGIDIAILTETHREFEKLSNLLLRELVDDVENRGARTQYPQILGHGSVYGFSVIDRFDGRSKQTKTFLRPVQKGAHLGMPKSVDKHESQSLLNFLSNLAVARNTVNGCHPENLMGITTWSVLGSSQGAEWARQEEVVAFMALIIDHADRAILRFWKIEEAELIYKDGVFKPTEETPEITKKKMATSQAPRELQAQREETLWNKLRSHTLWPRRFLESIRQYLQPDGRVGKRLLKQILHDFNRFYLTGYMGQKRALIPIMERYFQLRDDARNTRNRPRDPTNRPFPSKTWHKRQRTTRKKLDKFGFPEPGDDSDCSDYSSGENDPEPNYDTGLTYVADSASELSDTSSDSDSNSEDGERSLRVEESLSNEEIPPALMFPSHHRPQ
ncbi:Oidioi.mRNA.OKI2018_I69.chr1.g701.t3.cds [Oikopleura dioica]|uniref:Oidioi.mRNA.OKI2018_I69.chr1.g701.t3.cds n=1 Tax=Oikopleura dioica TaxID=34765 RepID=A0ABN7SPI2_OIKDI|nr:Oidioi.mRNA.OKI2018_I69.chr1.g701.t3.cds [Oikopleura dioica]